MALALNRSSVASRRSKPPCHTRVETIINQLYDPGRCKNPTSTQYRTQRPTASLSMSFMCFIVELLSWSFLVWNAGQLANRDSSSGVATDGVVSVRKNGNSFMAGCDEKPIRIAHYKEVESGLTMWLTVFASASAATPSSLFSQSVNEMSGSVVVVILFWTRLWLMWLIIVFHGTERGFTKLNALWPENSAARASSRMTLAASERGTQVMVYLTSQELVNGSMESAERRHAPRPTKVESP